MKKISLCLAGVIMAATLSSMRPSPPLPGKKDTVRNTAVYTAIPAGEETYYYDVKGNLAFTSRLISDTGLPLQVVRKLMRRFPDNYIRRVMKYHVEDHDIYFITLESKTGWRVLRVNNFNQVRIMEHLQKAG